ncbi:Tuberin-Rap/ran-GTPase-activating protein [Ceraceosorus bombacis]|uniref:Tuberin-Rap/ran-GTPase-activating protein n=1 Tax=Ceraceosorus bombacis TaxID=401625 RepID=A0A0P1BD81_9BASI|nr:Tuberin-Rap/ran-GTPase-activating protein [Ceraceosorus bombacis]
MDGRDVVAFKSIIALIGTWLHTMWNEIQILRRLAHAEHQESQQVPPSSPATRLRQLREARDLLSVQLSLREWNLQALLQLATSTFKFSFTKLDLDHVEDLFFEIAHLVLGQNVQADPSGVQQSTSVSAATGSSRRNRSKDARPLTEGYDYYGLEQLTPSSGSLTPVTSSATQNASRSPLLTGLISASANIAGPPPSTEASISPSSTPKVAPIALATIPPASQSNAPASISSNPSSELHASDVRAIIALFDAALRYGSVPPACVEAVADVLCCFLGHQAAERVKDGREVEEELDWRPQLLPVITNLLRSHGANAALRHVRGMLATTPSQANSHEASGASAHQHAHTALGLYREQLSVLLGAVSFLRHALFVVGESVASSAAHREATSNRQNEDALAPSVSIALILPALRGALARGKLQGHATSIFESTAYSSSAASAPAASMPSPVAALLKTISRVNLAPAATISRAEASLAAEGANTRFEQDSVPWTPKLVKLLLALAPLLPDATVVDLIKHFKAQHLCLPCDPRWIQNIRDLLQAFFHRHEQTARDFATMPAPKARIELIDFIFKHVYDILKDLPAQRSEFVLEIAIPLAKTSLANEADPEVASAITAVLVDAAVQAGSLPPDLPAPEHSDEESASGQEKDERDPGPPSPRELGQHVNERLAAVETSKSEQVFVEIRQLFGQLARVKDLTSTAATAANRADAGNVLTGHVSFADPPGSHDRRSGRDAQTQTHSRHSSVGNISVGVAPTTVPKRALASDKAVKSVLALIAVFNRMAFASSWTSFASSAEQGQSRRHASGLKQTRASCLTIFRDLLRLLQPPASLRGRTAEKESGTDSMQGSPSSAARLAILQWLLRLRTDRQHRIYLVADVDELVEAAATALQRGPDSTATGVGPCSASMEKQISTSSSTRPGRASTSARQEQREPRGVNSSVQTSERSKSRIREPSRDRGRANVESSRQEGRRERSTSRNRNLPKIPAGPPHPAVEAQEPLWQLPQRLHFEMPDSHLRSDVVYTYIHPTADPHCAHGHAHGHTFDDEDEAPIPLPVSEYLALMVRILATDKDWEIGSYLICHLPHQLANKHLFCGPKARDQIVALRKLLCSSILEHALMPELHLPEEVKRTDVYAVVYATLTILISYRTLFSRSQQDEMVEAFIAGLNKSQNTAQPCVRALSVACYELQKSVTRFLPAMLVKLSTVMSSTVMSVHILELIAAIGHIPACFANFTEADYRRIFGISLQYLQYHSQWQRSMDSTDRQANSTTSSAEDPRSSPAQFTLSQYVMMLAYYNISLWFISLRIPDRSKHVAYISRGLRTANEGREKLADQTEVCFDFLARFTHSNAEPKPTRSFLNSIVMGGTPAALKAGGGLATKDPNAVVKSWLFGKALVTVSTLKKTGWVEIVVRRPSGTAALLCKLENVPTSTLPDEDDERMDLPAMLMMQRDPDAMSRPILKAPTLQPSERADRLSLRQRAEQRLRFGDELRSRQPVGPPASLRPRTGRSASYSGGTSGDMLIRTAPVDPYRIEAANADLSIDEPHSTNLPRTGGPQMSATPSSAVMEVIDDVLSPTALSKEDQLAHLKQSSQEASIGAAADSAPSSERYNASTKPSANRSTRDAAIDPGFVALQLTAFPDMKLDETPLLLPNEPATDRLIRHMDFTPVVDFHKIGVLYVAPGQTQEQDILANATGSAAYARFLSGLGKLVTLKGQEDVYTGGLDRQADEHGKYAYVWGDDISQIVYHTATLMPTSAQDPNHGHKKALIGNDWVHIVWNEGGEEYGFDTIPSQFNFVNIVISPNSRGGTNLGAVAPDDSTFYRVSLQCKPGLPNFSPVSDGQLVSASALPAFVRILALNGNVVSQIFDATGATLRPYTSNWVSRLQHLGRAREKALAQRRAAEAQQGTESIVQELRWV